MTAPDYRGQTAEPLITRLRQYAKRCLRGLTRRKPPESLPIELSRRRIYILPTRFGVGFALVLLLMLTGALNYSNNSALLLTCLLGAVAINSILVAFRNLHGLRLLSLRAEPVCVGQTLHVQLCMDATVRPRTALRLDGYGDVVEICVTGTDDIITLPLPARSRGWMPLPRVRISTTWPFGLFRAWSWLHPQRSVLVYPAPERAGPAAASGNESQTQRNPLDGEALSGLREYRAGDPIKHIAWKLSARHHHLLVRELERPLVHSVRMFDWDHLHELSCEQRIARLARWVIEAHAQDLRWSLHLPSSTLGPTSGSEHYHRCMSALALLP